MRVLLIILMGVVCGVAGWYLHGPTALQTNSTAEETSGIESTYSSRSARTSEPFVNADNESSKKTHSRLPVETLEAQELRITETMERVFTTDANDLVDMMEGFGSLTRMTDAEVKIAWAQLSGRVPSNNFGGGLTVMYLWSRMWQMGEKVEFPVGWGVEDFEVALASEKARHQGDQNTAKMLQRLEAGESLSDTERRVLFGQAVRANPLEAVKLWCGVTKPGDYAQDAPWLFTALTDAGSRDAIMAELRKWQKGGDLGGAVTALARNWMDRDSEAVEQWLQQPAQADIRDVVMKEIIATRASANPVDAWEWSRSLPDAQRRDALGISAAQFASFGPDEANLGIELIAKLQNPEDRMEAVGKFGDMLAGNNIERWKQWRDTLSPKEQERVNEGAFDFWAASDVNAAVDWLEARPSGEAKVKMVTKLASLCAKPDPQTAVKLIRSIPDTTLRQEAVSAALTSVGPDDLESVQTILNGVSQN